LAAFHVVLVTPNHSTISGEEWLVPCIRTFLTRYVATERTSAVSFPVTNNDITETSSQSDNLKFGELGVKDRQQGDYFATLRVSDRQEIPQKH